MEAALPRKTMLLPGSTLGDTYTVVRLIGEGGMGEVYEVRHRRLAGRYAIKLIRGELISSNTTALQRFKREAEATSTLRHPNIVQVIDFNQTPDGAPYIVMEYLDGGDLETRMHQRGPMPVGEALIILEQIASALAAAHTQGIIHRDLKPQNILLVPLPVPMPGQRPEVVKVVDFGISKVKAVESLTSPPMIMGTPHYMAPEQAPLGGQHTGGNMATVADFSVLETTNFSARHLHWALCRSDQCQSRPQRYYPYFWARLCSVSLVSQKARIPCTRARLQG